MAGLLEVMAREGYASATIPKIAKAAKLTPGLVHHHFESKHAILVRLVELLRAGLQARAGAKLAAAGADPRARLDALLDAHVALGNDANPRAVAAWVLIGAEAVRDREVRALYQSGAAWSLHQLRARVGDCLRASALPTTGARAKAAALLSAIEGAYQLSASAPGLLPRGFAAPMLRRMADGLLGVGQQRP